MLNKFLKPWIPVKNKLGFSPDLGYSWGRQLQQFQFRQFQVNSMPVAFGVDMRSPKITDADQMVDKIRSSQFHSSLAEACQDQDQVFCDKHHFVGPEMMLD